MKQLITLLLLAISLFASAQSCKYEVNEVDKFTNKMTKRTKTTMLQNSTDKSLMFAAKREGDEVSFLFEYWECQGPKIDLKVATGSKMIFLMEDGSQIELKCNADVAGVARKSGFSNCSVIYNASYPITKEQTENLLKNKIQTLRFYRIESNGKEDYKDFEIKERNGEDLKELLKCVL